jgi:hypothetical protein
MVLNHHDLKIELDDAWWAEAGMLGFVPTGPSYRAGPDAGGRPIFLALINEIGPVRRNPGVGIFNTNETKTARQRVLCILKGFRENVAIPIEVVDARDGYPYRFKPMNGTHRLYCSLAVGFTYVPAVQGWEPENY